MRHTSSEGENGSFNLSGEGAGGIEGSFSFYEPLSNVDEEISYNQNMKLMSKLSIEEKCPSAESAKRSLPTSFDTSFEQMTSFEVYITI